MARNLTYRHLNETTNRAMEGELFEGFRVAGVTEELRTRMLWSRRKHFAYHPPVQEIIDELEWAFTQIDSLDEGEVVDLISLAIVAPSGCGKSSIIREFARIHSPVHHPTHEGYPVRHALLKDGDTGLKGLYSALLFPFNHPLSRDEAAPKGVTVDRYENALLGQMEKAGTRMFFPDEFQHVKGKNMKSLVNQLKHTMDIAQVPFVPTGTPDVRAILHADLQLADRFPVMELEMMSISTTRQARAYQTFLKGYEEFMPLPEPSQLGSVDIATAVFNKVRIPERHNGDNQYVGSTNVRRITKFVQRATVTALRQGSENITVEIINGLNAIN